MVTTFIASFVVIVICFIICGISNEKYWPFWVDLTCGIIFWASVVVLIMSGGSLSCLWMSQKLIALVS